MMTFESERVLIKEIDERLGRLYATLRDTDLACALEDVLDAWDPFVYSVLDDDTHTD